GERSRARRPLGAGVSDLVSLSRAWSPRRSAHARSLRPRRSADAPSATQSPDIAGAMSSARPDASVADGASALLRSRRWTLLPLRANDFSPSGWLILRSSHLLGKKSSAQSGVAAGPAGWAAPGMVSAAPGGHGRGP